MSNPGPSLRGAVDLSGLVRRANAPTPAPGSSPTPSSGASGVVIEATEETFPQVVELSNRVPVVVELYAPGLTPALGSIVESYGGRLVLATVDAQANPGIAEAFQVREVPAAAAIVAGRPVPLFVGTPVEDQVRQVFDQLLQVAAQNGVTGAVTPTAPGDPGDGSAAPAEPAEEPLPPLHQEAFDAISAGDYAGAIAAYKKAITQNPRDALAVAGLAQASLLQRLEGAVADEVRKAAADAPASAAAQLAVADLDVSGGHLDDAFDRLLELFPALDGEGREAVRTRLLEYFEIAGPDDPRVAAARRRLTLLLY